MEILNNRTGLQGLHMNMRGVLMLNERKIRIMTKAAIYEKRDGVDDLKINTYYHSDYVRVNLLKTLVGVTICAFLICGVYILYEAEFLLANIITMDIPAFCISLLMKYILVLVIYAVISLVYYNYKYLSARKRVKGYYGALKKIDVLSGVNEGKETIGGNNHGN